MPKRPGAVCGLPRGGQALTDAPLLERLQDLNRQPRKIGKQIADGKWEWYGDLTIPREFVTAQVVGGSRNPEVCD